MVKALLLVLAALCISIVSSVPSDEQCQSLLQVSSGNTQCTPHGDCTGLTCVNSITSTNSTFTVDKCQDPVLVNVSVTTNGNTYQRIFNQSTNVMSGIYMFNWTMNRNATYIQVMGVITLQGVPIIAIPLTAVPLNASVCMCQSIQDIADRGEHPVDTDCVNNSQCNGLDCTFNIGFTTYNVETEIQPCSQPPGFFFIVSHHQTGNVVFEKYFNSSTNSSHLFGFPLHVVVIHKPYSMIIEIDLIINNSTYRLVPRSQVILDKSKCNMVTPSPTLTTPTITPFITPTPVPISSETCTKIKQIAANPMVGTCTTNTRCDTVTCTSLGYTSVIQILPCYNPPALYIVLKDQNQNVVFRKIVTNNTIISIQGSVIQLDVTLKHKENSIGIEFGVRTPFNTFDIVPYTEIPLDRCVCRQVSCSSYALRTSYVSKTTSYVLRTTSKYEPTMTSKSDSSISKATVLAISVPLLLVVIVVIVVVVVMIMLVLFFKKKNRYSNQEGSDLKPIKFDILSENINENE